MVSYFPRIPKRLPEIKPTVTCLGTNPGDSDASFVQRCRGKLSLVILMAFILCDEHGGMPGLQVCPHIFAFVANGRRIKSAVTLDAKHLGEPAWRVHLCTGCAERHGYTESALVSGGDALDILMAFEQSPVCGKCFDRLRGQVAAD